jgi:hypothetical protein
LSFIANNSYASVSDKNVIVPSKTDTKPQHTSIASTPVSVDYYHNTSSPYFFCCNPLHALFSCQPGTTNIPDVWDYRILKAEKLLV